MSSRIRLGVGLLTTLIAALLLFLGIIESGAAAVIGIVGIGLMGSSSDGILRQKTH